MLIWLKGKKGEGKRGEREGERKRRKMIKKKGSREGLISESVPTVFPGLYTPTPWFLPANFRTLSPLQSSAVKLKLSEWLSLLQKQFSLRVTVTDAILLSYFGFWTPTHDSQIFRSWFSELSFLWSSLHLFSNLVLSLCQLGSLQGCALIIEKFFVVRVNLLHHSLYSLIWILHSEAVWTSFLSTLQHSSQLFKHGIMHNPESTLLQAKHLL